MTDERKFKGDMGLTGKAVMSPVSGANVDAEFQQSI